MYSQTPSPVQSTLMNGWKRQTPRSPGDVPTAVKNLLVSTKGLQDSLQQWSLHQVSENEVSDIYVTVGTEFNNAINAFAHHRIDLSDIHSVPKDLRQILESCLGEDPSPQSLAMYMPAVRTIIYKMLWGLRSKQEAWKVVHGGRNMF